jgi:hypothetical protein
MGCPNSCFLPAPHPKRIATKPCFFCPPTPEAKSDSCAARSFIIPLFEYLILNHGSSRNRVFAGRGTYVRGSLTGPRDPWISMKVEPMTDMPPQWNVCTLLCADTRGHGRYIIKKFEAEWLLELNGELIGRFGSPGEARARAEVGVKTAPKMAAESAPPGWSGALD